MKLITGPHGSGKTHRLARIAAEHLTQRKRVGYLTLPHARAHALRRITADTGGGVGLEVLHFQQLYTRILAGAGRLGAPVNLIARVALVGRALSEELGAPPSPGEASLFARAIAELKRFGYAPDQVPTGLDPEIDRLQRVYERYEALKNGGQDPDDRRHLATHLMAEGAGMELDVLLVDGFRELSPAEIGFLEAASDAGVEVVVALPEPPPGRVADEVLGPAAVEAEHYAHANPVEEARWILTRAKQLLVDGVDPTEIAILAPEPLLPLYRLYAADLGVPLNDEAPRPLAETPAGRFLSALLTLPDRPDPSVLQQIPELAELAEAVFLAGVAGREAVHKLAEAGGHLEALEAAEARMTPSGDLEAWIKGVLDGHPLLAGTPWKEALLAAGFEAVNLLGDSAADHPEALRGWWIAMLGFLRPRTRPTAGVTLLPPQQLAGRRYRHAFVAYAVAGAYQARTQEDYFLPDAEPFRQRWEDAFLKAGLPMRLRDQTVRLWEEVRAAGRHVVLSFPLASASGKLEPEPGLLPLERYRDADGRTTIPLAPALPPAHEREVRPPVERPALPLGGPAPLEPGDAEDLRSFAECGWRYWLRRLRVREDEAKPAWAEALRRLAEAERAGKPLATADLEALKLRVSPDWTYRFWPREHVDGVPVRVHALAVNATLGRAYVLRFVDEPVADRKAAQEKIRRRWAEHLMALHYLRQGFEVTIRVRSLEDGQSHDAYTMRPSDLSRPHRWPAKSLLAKLEDARKAREQIARASLHYAPNPNTCYGCDFRDVCRRPQT